MKKYSDEKRRMFRTTEQLDGFVQQLKDASAIIIKRGYICQSTYRNFGYKYGVIYKEKLANKKNMTFTQRN